MNRAARVIVGISCAAAVGGMTWWGLMIMSDPPTVENDSSVSVNERESVNEEPIGMPVRTVLTDAPDWRAGLVPCDTPSGSTMTIGCYVDGERPYMVTDDGEMFYVDDATGERTYVESGDEPWLIASDGSQHFEDGSWIDADGTTGCTEGMPCDSRPPVPAGEPTTPNGGYFPTLNLRPCLVEDDENCYWDAARMGNGQGTSFIRLDGITYYPEASK